MKNLRKIRQNRIKAYELLFRMGTTTGCHQDPNKGFFIKGYQFPICARCTGIWTGYIFGLISINFIDLPTCLCIIMPMIMFYDWYAQYLTIKESTNSRRYITGICYGIAIVQLLFKIFNLLLGKIDILRYIF